AAVRSTCTALSVATGEPSRRFLCASGDRYCCRISAVKRRDFLTRSALALLGITARAQPASGEPIIDIHQHLGYSGRPDDVLLAHQRAIGATTTILLPAGRSANRPSTHGGLANGLQAEALGNDACNRFVQAIVAHSGSARTTRSRGCDTGDRALPEA